MRPVNECPDCGWWSYDGEEHNCRPAAFRFEDIALFRSPCPWCGFSLSCEVCTAPVLERQFFSGSPFQEGHKSATNPPESRKDAG